MISFTPYPAKDRPVYGVPLAVFRRAPSSPADPGPMSLSYPTVTS
ncbi:hypothetical protein B0E54_03648 [Micromonospora sp. MH99]|nr:hypothetical protein [Micromonospora sp. MH99]